MADDTRDINPTPSHDSDLTSTPLDPSDSALVIDSKPAEDPVPEAKPQRSGGMRASEIMAAVTGDDWTMTPDASSPTVLPRFSSPGKRCRSSRSCWSSPITTPAMCAALATSTS